MAIKYYKLFDILTRRGLKRFDLVSLAGIAPPTLTKIIKGESITTYIIDKMCAALEVQPGDIMEWIPADQNTATAEEKPTKNANQRR